MAEPKRAAIYCRVSSQGQDTPDAESLPEQLRLCRELAADKGYTVVAELKDVQTATSRKRKGYLELCRLVASGEVDTVIAWKEDRLYRGFGVVPFYEATEQNPDINVQLVTGHWDRRQMMLMAGVAQMELEAIRERTLMGRRAKLAKGHLPGGSVAYGYARGEDGKPVVVKDEAEIVRQLYSWYLADVPRREMVKRLNAQGTPARRNKRWSYSTVGNILDRAELYCTGTDTVTLNGEQFVIEYPPILPSTMLPKVEAQKAAYRAAPQRVRHVHHHLLGGLIYCPCGWAMAARYDTRFAEKWPRTNRYRCHRADTGRTVDPACPKRVAIPDVDPYVWALVEQKVFDKAHLRQLVQERLEEATGNQRKLEAERATANKRLAAIADERLWAIRHGRTGQIDDEEFAHTMGELALERTMLENKLARLAADLELATAGPDLAEAWLATVDRVSKDHHLLNARWQEVETDSASNLVPGPVSVGRILPNEEPTDEAGEPAEAVHVSVAELCHKLGAAEHLEEADGNWGTAVRLAQIQRKRQLVRTFVERVTVSQGEGEAPVIDVQFAFDLPLEGVEAATRSTQPSSGWQR